jgi:hypothetical protein
MPTNTDDFTDTHLIGQITRAHDFSNRARTITKPAGTEVAVRIENLENDRPCVLAYIPGTRYSAVLPKTMITPAE